MSGANGYSLRDRSGTRPDRSTDEQKRRRTGDGPQSNDLLPASIQNASSVLYVGGFPPDWNAKHVESLVAGSGRIVDIRPRIDPGGRKNFAFVEYYSSQEAENALKLLMEVTIGPRRKLRVEVSKEGLRTHGQRERPILVLDRKFLPAYVNLPIEMRNNTEYVLNSDMNSGQQSTSNAGTPVPNVPTVANFPSTSTIIPQIPDILTQASKYLPPFNTDAFKSDDKISENLQAIPPPNLIEILSSLKNMIAKNETISATQVFNAAPSIPIAVSQALVLMGLIDQNMIRTALETSSLSTPPPPPPQSQLQQQQQQQQLRHPATQPGWETFSYQTVDKLSKMDPGQATMIAQVLRLSPHEIAGLPQDQVSVITGIKAQYL